MPDRRRHRGPAPEDAQAFAPEMLSRLCESVHDLSWLQSRGYPDAAALKLVGDRFRLTQRQRKSVSSVAASDEDAATRLQRRISFERLVDKPLDIDGYNILTSLETALSGGVVLVTRDGSHRDLAAIHGTYRQVEETIPALEAIGNLLDAVGCARAHWLLDRPVSNSARLKETIESVARARNWPWSVELVRDPDPLLAASEHVVATADRVILNQCRAWIDLVGAVLPTLDVPVWLVDLRET